MRGRCGACVRVQEERTKGLREESRGTVERLQGDEKRVNDGGRVRSSGKATFGPLSSRRAFNQW